MGACRKECITFVMTTRCNLLCTYCYLRHETLPDQSIDMDFAKQGLRDFFNVSKSRHIRFYGSGEPTLEMKKIKEILNYAKELSPGVKAEIQTNGIFSTETAKWLAENMDIIWISCDGTPDIQNKQRPAMNGQATASIIERNLSTIHKFAKSSEIVVGARSTITPSTLHRQEEILTYFSGLGLKAVYADPIFSPISGNVHEDKMTREFLLEYCNEFLRLQGLAEKHGIFWGSLLTVNFDEPTEIYCRACLPVPHLTTDGYVSACTVGAFGDTFPDLIYGKYDPSSKKIEYDSQKIDRIRHRRIANLGKCSECPVASNCGGGCIGDVIGRSGNFMSVWEDDYCECVKMLAKELPRNKGLYPYLHP